MFVADTSEVEAVKSALAEARKEAEEERASRLKHESRVEEVQQELKDAIGKCEFLECKNSEQNSELAKALQSAQEAQDKAQSVVREIQEARQNAAGKAFNMQSKFVKKRYIFLTRIWSSPGVFADLPWSVADAAEFFRTKEGSSTEKLFWSQYLAPEHPVPLSDQLKQWTELHRVAELAMRDLIIRLWPAEPMPSSYFGLVKRLIHACPRLDAVKRSVCIEGARMAFARVKVQWAKMDAVKLATEGPPAGKEHRTPERYFEDVLEGSRIVEGQCSKDIIFE